MGLGVGGWGYENFWKKALGGMSKNPMGM